LSIFGSAAKIHFCLSPICAKLSIGIAMAIKNSKQRRNKPDNADGFRISNGPVIQSAEEAGTSTADFGDAVALPRAYGAPMLFAIARDPQTIFTYWSIDWPTIFAEAVPVDRQVHLRVYRNDGAQETSAAVEPMAGNCFLPISQPRGVYRVEIGYFQPADVWNSVATSHDVAMPADNVGQDADVALATIPLHLSFQRLIDLFRASNGAALAETISRFQKRVLSVERELLTQEEREILRETGFSLSEIARARRAFIEVAASRMLRKRAEATLSSDLSSPRGGFGGSSWASAAS
jgi:DNA-binding CsgD family transcriptional regulator